jgi:hypothetical protein
MSTREYCVYNETRENLLSARVAFIDTRSDPLKAVKVLIEGLAPNADTGLWLNPLKTVPAVPRLAAYDLVYLDHDGCVVHGVELVPDEEAPKFDGTAASALVLPIHSFAASRAMMGDRFVLRPAEEMQAVAAAVVTRTKDPTTATVGLVEPIAKEPSPAMECPAALVVSAGTSTQIFSTSVSNTASGAAVASTGPEPRAGLETAAVGTVVPEQLGPLAWPVKWCAQTTALEPVNPLGEARVPAKRVPRFTLLYRLAHLRIRVQISISTAPAGDHDLQRPRLERNAGWTRSERLGQLSKRAMDGLRSRGAQGAVLVRERWIACKAAYFRWAESFMFRPAGKAASIPPAEMLPPSLSYTRKPRFLR